MNRMGVGLALVLAIAGCVKVGSGSLTAEKRAKLIEGYPALYDQLKEFGCPRCHTTGPQVIANRFKLPAPGEDDSLAVEMLWNRLDTVNVAASKLVRKPNGEMGHRGGKILNPPTRETWIAELMRWYRS